MRGQLRLSFPWPWRVDTANGLLRAYKIFHVMAPASDMAVGTLTLLPVKAFDALVEYPVRVGIMNALSRGPLTVTDIASRLNVAKGIVHRHIRALSKLGWVMVADEELIKALNLNREANRVYYMASSLIYFGYTVEQSDDSISLRISRNYAAFLDSKRGALIVRTPKTAYGCLNPCVESEDCLLWASKMAKKLKIPVDLEGLQTNEALRRLFYSILVKSFTTPRANLPLIKIIDIKIDHAYRQWLGNPIGGPYQAYQ